MEQLDATNRSRNLVITGVCEDKSLEDVTDDHGKCALIFQKIGMNEVEFEERRIGKEDERKKRPLLVTFVSNRDRNQILNDAKKLKNEGDNFKTIYVKKDTHPAIRKEWKRLFDAKEEEEKKAENAGVTITVDKRRRVLLKDGVIIDNWRPSFFF